VLVTADVARASRERPSNLASRPTERARGDISSREKPSRHRALPLRHTRARGVYETGQWTRAEIRTKP
jgi:hypothetical protein